MIDVSRQNIAGKHGNFCNNALFFWSMNVDDGKARRFLLKDKGERIKEKVGRKKRFIFLLLALLAACGGVKNDSATSSSVSQVPMRVVTDDLGRTVTVPVKITRAVSLAPSLTENIFAVGAGDRLVGVTTFCNYPEAAKSIAKIGDTMNPNMESIVALKPDVVFVSTASQIEAFTKTLEANGIAVYVTNPKDLEGLFENLTNLGRLFGTESAADILVTQLRDRSNKCFIPVRAPQRVFVQISKEPLFTIGRGAFVTELVKTAGGISVTADVESAYPKISKETASALDPEVIILSESDDNKEPNEVFNNSPAVKKGRVFKINADLLSRPGPRLVDALDQIAKDLHPEKFK
ncbi:MAG: cobalamin-binding protein [Chloracidobacterium sp.]|nr:cobalamin-binding protein [Chloracidobacterium sp.]